MNAMARRLAAALVGVGLLAGCASAPVTRHYTLAAAPVAGSQAPLLQVAVAPVQVPEGLARPQLVVRRTADAPAGRIEILEQSRWASSFDEELRLAFADGIASALGARDVSLGGALADLPVWRVGIQLRRYEAIPGNRVALVFDWSVGRADQALQIACQTGIVRALPAGSIDDLVQGVRAVVGQTAQAIAESVRTASHRLAAPTAAGGANRGCPSAA